MVYIMVPCFCCVIELRRQGDNKRETVQMYLLLCHVSCVIQSFFVFTGM